MHARLSQRLVGAAAALAVTAALALTSAGAATAAPSSYTPGPDVLTNDTTPTFTLPAGSDFTFTLDGDPVTLDAGTTVDLPELPEGTHELVIEYLDTEGAAQSVTTSIIVDVTPPDGGIGVHGHGPTAGVAYFQPGAELELEVQTYDDDVVAYEYRINNGPWISFPGTVTVTAEPGAYVVQFRMWDAAGNVSGPGLEDVYWVGPEDSTAPTVQGLTQKPAAASKDLRPTFAWTTDDFAHQRNVDIELDGMQIGYVDPQATSWQPGWDLEPGEHTFTVAVRDWANNISDPVSYTWTILPEAPQLAITKTSLNADSTKVRIDWTLDEPATVWGSLDGAAPAVMTGTSYTANVAYGDHTFTLAALDSDGNLTPVSPATTVKWTASDKTAPKVTLTKSALNADSTKVKLSWSSSETATVYASLDGAAPKVVTGTSATVDVKYGAHRYELYAVDAAGNKSATSSVTWTASDKTAPDMEAYFGAYSPFDGRLAVVYFFLYTDPNAKITATFDGKPATVVADQGYAYAQGFKLGRHTFVVTATDAAGNSTKSTQSFVAKPAVVYSDIPASRLAKGIKAGSKKADIYAVQAGLSNPEDVQLGVYDSATAKHVKAWQKRNHLYVTGVVNTLTWKSMVNAAADKSPKRVITKSSISSTTLKKGVRAGAKGQAVVDIQRLLKVKETGTFTSSTTKAVKAFQKKKHLKVTGVVNASTWAKLVG